MIVSAHTVVYAHMEEFWVGGRGLGYKHSSRTEGGKNELLVLTVTARLLAFACDLNAKLPFNKQLYF